MTEAEQRIHDCLDSREGERGWVTLMAPDVRALLAERDALKAENEKLLTLERDVSNTLPGVYYMDPPDGGSTPLGEQVRRMAADAERYRWLRDQCPGADRAPDVWHTLCKKPRTVDDLLDRVADLDAAIDAARGKE